MAGGRGSPIDRERRTRDGELLLVRVEDGTSGERWDVPRDDGRPEARWWSSAELRAKWDRLELALTADAAACLESEGRELASVGGARVIEAARSVRVLPVRTPTLPPASHTNVIVIGTHDAVVIEPATPYAEELDLIAEWIGVLQGQGARPRAILLTHHHIDHVGGARALQQALGLPLWAHAETAARLRRDIVIERSIADGETIALEGRAGVRAIHTPGHAPGHLCYLDVETGVLVAGDMIAGVGTILIEPRDGDMALYLESLERMIALDPVALIPAHGGVLRRPRLVLEHFIEHRRAREKKVLAALARLSRPAQASALLPEAYADTPRAAWPLALLSTESHLIKLEREGAVQRQADGWIVS